MEKLNQATVRKITSEFYSRFCGIDLADLKAGIHFVCFDERGEEVKGFGCKYTIYTLHRDDLLVVSYSPDYCDLIESLKNCTIEEILDALNQKFKLRKMQLMQFEHERVQDYGNAKVLQKKDYALYEKFFCMQHPSADPSGWLQEYFEEKTAKEYFVGYVVNGSLVSVCDAPDMPFMEDIIQHTGIVTLTEERRKGYAKCTAALAAHQLIENGVCPQWECRSDNDASIALAESIGYQKYGVAYILEE